MTATFSNEGLVPLERETLMYKYLQDMCNLKTPRAVGHEVQADDDASPRYRDQKKDNICVCV